MKSSSNSTAVPKIIFIDRDGVINVDLIGDYIKSWDAFRFEAGAIQGLRKLTDAGYEIVIISNQAGIGDGLFTEEALKDIQKNMLRTFEENGIRIRSSHYCLHGKNEGCQCRKPETGLFDEALQGQELDRSQTYFIGDKASDIEAGKRFGLRTIFVRTGHGKLDEPKLTGKLIPDHITENLESAAKIITE